MSFEEVLKCGSNLEMSPAWAATSSFFWVVWAGGARERGRNRPGGAQGGGALEQVASGQFHCVGFLLGFGSVLQADPSGRSRRTSGSLAVRHSIGAGTPRLSRSARRPKSGPAGARYRSRKSRSGRVHVLELAHAQVLDGQPVGARRAGCLAEHDLAVARLRGQARRDDWWSCRRRYRSSACPRCPRSWSRPAARGRC